MILIYSVQGVLYAKISLEDIFSDEFLSPFPDEAVYTVTDFRGNYANEFTTQLINDLRTKKNIQFVDYDDQKMVLHEMLKYTEPVFDGKHSDGMPNFVSPDYMIRGSANLQKSNILFKQKQHLDYELNLFELSSSLNLLNVNERIRYRYNPPILLLIILIVLILGIARWMIYLKRGYNVKSIIIASMLLVTVILVWWVL